MSDGEIFHIQGIYYLFFCLLEIPKKLIVNRFSSKKILFIGTLILIISTAIPIGNYYYTIFPTYYSAFLIHFILIALARSLVDVASFSWLYEYMNKENIMDQYEDTHKRVYSLSLYSRVLAWVPIGWLIGLELTIPYILSFIASIIALYFVTKLIEIPPRKKSYKNNFSNLRIHASSPWIWLLLLQSMSVFIVMQIICTNLYQPILYFKSVNISTLGWGLALMAIFEIIGNTQSHTFLRKIKNRNTVLIFGILLPTYVLFMPFMGTTGTLFLLILCSMTYGYLYPLIREMLEKSINNFNEYQTIITFESMVNRLGCALVLFLASGFLNKNHLPLFLMIFSLTVILIISITYLAIRYYSKNNAKVPL